MGITRGFSGRAARRAQGLGGIGSWTKKRGWEMWGMFWSSCTSAVLLSEWNDMVFLGRFNIGRSSM